MYSARSTVVGMFGSSTLATTQSWSALLILTSKKPMKGVPALSPGASSLSWTTMTVPVKGSEPGEKNP